MCYSFSWPVARWVVISSLARPASSPPCRPGPSPHSPPTNPEKYSLCIKQTATNRLTGSGILLFQLVCPLSAHQVLTTSPPHHADPGRHLTCVLTPLKILTCINQTKPNHLTGTNMLLFQLVRRPLGGRLLLSSPRLAPTMQTRAVASLASHHP